MIFLHDDLILRGGAALPRRVLFRADLNALEVVGVGQQHGHGVGVTGGLDLGAAELDQRLAGRGYRVCFMAEYYLPDVERMPQLSCPYETRVLEQADFAGLYLPQWGNALCEDRKQLDVLGVGAYDGGKLIGLAGCSADCETMWQIGVDVLPEYRRRGVASALTGRLAREIIERGKVPFYCSAWSNIRSVRNAIRSGFIPAWVEMTVKPVRVVEEMNQTEAENRSQVYRLKV